MKRVSIWWANTLPRLCIFISSWKHAFSKFQKFSKLISNLFDKIYDVLSMISNSSLACSLGTLPPTPMYLHVLMQTCMFKISKLSFNTIDRAYAALTMMFSFLPAGFDRAFNFFFNIMICDKFLEASNLQFLTNLWKNFMFTTSLSCFLLKFSFFGKRLRL